MPPREDGYVFFPQISTDGEKHYLVMLEATTKHRPQWPEGPPNAKSRQMVCLACWCCPTVLWFVGQEPVPAIYCNQCMDGKRIP